MFDFESMSKKKRALYEGMWGSPEFDFPVEKTVYKGVKTSNSYTFADTSAEEEDVCRERLEEIFKITNKDIVLVGTHKNTGMPVVFFVESKFSEYYERTGKQLEVAVEYLNNRYSEPIYRSNCLRDMKFRIVEQPENTNFVLASDDLCYVEGIKQMISHYVGVRNFCDNPAKYDKVIFDAVSNGARIFLGEILFTKEIGQLPIGNGKSSLDSYQEKYHILAKAMNNQLLIDGKNNQIKVLSNLLSYLQFQNSSCIKEKQIKRFYFEMGKNPKRDN